MWFRVSSELSLLPCLVFTAVPPYCEDGLSSFWNYQPETNLPFYVLLWFWMCYHSNRQVTNRAHVPCTGTDASHHLFSVLLCFPLHHRHGRRENSTLQTSLPWRFWMCTSWRQCMQCYACCWEGPKEIDTNPPFIWAQWTWIWIGTRFRSDHQMIPCQLPLGMARQLQLSPVTKLKSRKCLLFSHL